MANKKKQFDQEFKQNAVNYCLTHPELSRKECAKNLGIVISSILVVCFLNITFYISTGNTYSISQFNSR